MSHRVQSALTYEITICSVSSHLCAEAKIKKSETINIAGLLGCSERRSCIICGHLLLARKPCCSGCCLCIQPCPCHFLSHLFFGTLPIEFWPSKIHTLRQRGRINGRTQTGQSGITRLASTGSH